jgi:hypothetical protein
MNPQQLPLVGLHQPKVQRYFVGLAVERVAWQANSVNQCRKAGLFARNREMRRAGISRNRSEPPGTRGLRASDAPNPPAGRAC